MAFSKLIWEICACPNLRAKFDLTFRDCWVCATDDSYITRNIWGTSHEVISEEIWGTSHEVISEGIFMYVRLSFDVLAQTKLATTFRDCWVDARMFFGMIKNGATCTSWVIVRGTFSFMCVFWRYIQDQFVGNSTELLAMITHWETSHFTQHQI